MSRLWLGLALVLLSACYRNNPANCIASPGMCKPGLVCDPIVERCVNPDAMRCESASCPTGFSCNDQTLRCDPDTSSLNITGIDNPYIRSSGEVVVITGSGFQLGAVVRINGVPASMTEVMSSTELRVTAPARPVGTNKCGKLPLTVVNPDQTQKTVERFIAYYFDRSAFMPQSLPISIDGDVSRMVMADLNRDGFAELAVNRTSKTPLIYAGAPGGLTTTSSTPPGAIASSSLAADLEASQGYLLLTDALNGSNQVYRYATVAGTPSMMLLNQFMLGIKLNAVVPVDLDGDGVRDVLGLQTTGQLAGITRTADWMMTNTIQVPTLGITATSFVADRYFGNAARAAAVAFNDNKLELLLYDAAMRKLRAEVTLTLPEKAVEILEGDVDGDDKKDLVVLLATGGARVYLNKDAFSDANILDVPLGGLVLASGAVGDINCDGIADVIGLTSNAVRIWSQRTGLMPAFTIPNSGNPGSTVADVDGDAIGDLILFNTPNLSLVRFGVPKN